jgi:hypothetical protein
MFPLMHVKAVIDVHGIISDELIVGALLPDVLRLTGCRWDKSHSSALYLKDTLGRCHDITLGALIHGEMPKGIDYVSDVQFSSVSWGWAFYRAWLYVGVYRFSLPTGLIPWVFHNMIEAAVDMYLFEMWDRRLIKHIEDIYSWNIDWEYVEKRIYLSGLKPRRSIGKAFEDYLGLSLAKYGDDKCFVKSLYEIARRKFYRHGIILDISPDTFRNIWLDIYGDRNLLYQEFVKYAYPVIEVTYKEWCDNERI